MREADLLEYGDIVEISYGTGPYKVIHVNETETYGLPTYSLTLIPPEADPRDDGTFPDSTKKYINELVAQDGDIKKFFATNDDRVEKTGKADTYQGRLSMYAGES